MDGGMTPAREAVNLSGPQFETPGTLETYVAAVLTETRLPPRLLELTETVLMNALRELNGLIGRLGHLDVTIAIYDFGTGFSSLDYLKRFPADRIKIALNFVRHLETMAGMQLS